MQFRQRISDIIVTRVNLANSIRWQGHTSSTAFGATAIDFPSVALMPSHTAPTNPVTIIVMAALKV